MCTILESDLKRHNLYTLYSNIFFTAQPIFAHKVFRIIIRIFEWSHIRIVIRYMYSILDTYDQKGSRVYCTLLMCWQNKITDINRSCHCWWLYWYHASIRHLYNHTFDHWPPHFPPHPTLPHGVLFLPFFSIFQLQHVLKVAYAPLSAIISRVSSTSDPEFSASRVMLLNGITNVLTSVMIATMRYISSVLSPRQDMYEEGCRGQMPHIINCVVCANIRMHCAIVHHESMTGLHCYLPTLFT